MALEQSDSNTCLISVGTTQYLSTADWMYTLKETTNHTCYTCSKKLLLMHQFAFPLPFIVLEFSDRTMIMDDVLYIPINQTNITYKLRGIIYFGMAHFTSHIIYENGMASGNHQRPLWALCQALALGRPLSALGYPLWTAPALQRQL